MSSLLFGGAAGHRVNFGSHASLDNIGTEGGFTMGAWVYPTAADLSGGIFGKGIGTNNNRRALEFRDTVVDNAFFCTVDLSTTDAAFESSALSVRLNQWQLIVATYNDTTKLIWLHQGFPGGEINVMTGTQTTGSGNMGDNSGADQFYGAFGAGTSGSVAHRGARCFIYRRILSMAEMYQTAYNNAVLPGCVLHAKLGFNQQAVVADQSPFGNHGTIVSATQAADMPLWTPYSRARVRDYSLPFFEPVAATGSHLLRGGRLVGGILRRRLVG